MKKILNLIIILFLFLGVTNALSSKGIDDLNKGTSLFTDLGNHWGSESITRLHNMGSMNGYPDGTVRPNENITRAEFLALVSKTIHSEAIKSPKEGEHWATPYFDRALDYSVLIESEVRMDTWDEAITRYEMAKIIVRFLEEVISEKSMTTQDMDHKMEDYELVKEHQNAYYIEQAFAKGIITGKNSKGLFAGNDYGTRAEAATLIIRLIDSNEREPVNLSKTINYINNYSFETNKDWQNLSRSNNGYYSPVDGNYVAYQRGGNDWISQETNLIIEPNKNYLLTLYGRSVNEAYNDAYTELEVALFADDEEIVSVIKPMNVKSLKGAPENNSNDDGANIWIDGDYRMQFSDTLMYQKIEQNPINDPWYLVKDSEYDEQDYMAIGHINIPNGKKFIYGTIYEDLDEPYSEIWMCEVTGTAPYYEFSNWALVLEHYGDQYPWVIDAHIFYDEKSQRMWMSWGGHELWLTELDTETGKVLDNPTTTEFDLHPKDTHRAIAEFIDDDEWSVGYMEGPAIFKHEDYYYYFGTYGDLSENYTIRVGRSEKIEGPYFDQNGIDLIDGGGTLVLGNEGNHLVPGHPHIWKENEIYYLGYDYRRELDQEPDEEFDFMGIRELYWVNGWPTVYKPVQLSFDGDDYPEFIGRSLKLGFKNSGDLNSELTVDSISLQVID